MSYMGTTPNTLPDEYTDLENRTNIKIGAKVKIVLKTDQGTGKQQTRKF